MCVILTIKLIASKLHWKCWQSRWWLYTPTYYRMSVFFRFLSLVLFMFLLLCFCFSSSILSLIQRILASEKNVDEYRQIAYINWLMPISSIYTVIKVFGQSVYQCVDFIVWENIMFLINVFYAKLHTKETSLPFHSGRMEGLQYCILQTNI